MPAVLLPALLSLSLLPAARADDCVEVPGIEGSCVPVAPACPCFTAAELAAGFPAVDSYALYWARRPSGQNDQLSLRTESWDFVCAGSPTAWSAPTTGIDLYRDCGQTDGGTCERWTDTWLAAPVHDWADDGTSTTLALDEDAFLACQELAWDHIIDQALWTASW